MCPAARRNRSNGREQNAVCTGCMGSTVKLYSALRHLAAPPVTFLTSQFAWEWHSKVTLYVSLQPHLLPVALLTSRSKMLIKCMTAGPSSLQMLASRWCVKGSPCSHFIKTYRQISQKVPYFPNVFPSACRCCHGHALMIAFGLSWRNSPMSR